MEHEKILKLVEECAATLSPDKIEGIKKLEGQFKDDPLTLKSLLTLVALQFSEHSEFITSYLLVGVFLAGERERMTIEEHLKHYPSIRNIVISKLDLVNLLLHKRKYDASEEAIRYIIEVLGDLLHDMAIGRNAVPNMDARKGKIHDAINVLQKRLNRLSDFVVVANQDKILREMAELQSSMKNLETSVQEHITSDF